MDDDAAAAAAPAGAMLFVLLRLSEREVADLLELPLLFMDLGLLLTLVMSVNTLMVSSSGIGSIGGGVDTLMHGSLAINSANDLRHSSMTLIFSSERTGGLGNC